MPNKSKSVPPPRRGRAQAPKNEVANWRDLPGIPDGWKRVPKGRRIQNQDHFWCSGTMWTQTHNPGLKTDGVLTYIRPIPKTPQASAKRLPRSRPQVQTPPQTQKEIEMSTMREDSKGTWTSGGAIEHINAGSLQRIADGVEKMAASYSEIISDRDRYKRLYEEERARVRGRDNQIRGLRGVITKLKGKEAQP